MDRALLPFPTAPLFFFSFFFCLIPLLLHLLSFSSRMQTSQLKWVTAGCFCWIDIRYHTIHQAADSSPMPSLEESIPMCTTHMHTHNYDLPLLKSPFSRFEFPYPAFSRQGLGLREGESWIESCEASCKSTVLEEVGAYFLLMLFCRGIRWDPCCFLHLWRLESKCHSLWFGFEDSRFARHQHATALSPCQSCFFRKLHYVNFSLPTILARKTFHGRCLI